MFQKFSLCFLIYLVGIGDSATIQNAINKQEKIILDVDAGADDALGIYIVIKNEKIFGGPEIIAITCVAGNTNLKNVRNNVLRTLNQLEEANIPVYLGADSAIFNDEMISDNFFGEDGFGDFSFEPKLLKEVEREHAVTALIRLVSENVGQITLIALGPLTNIAIAMKLDPYFLKRLKKLVIGGGSVYGMGNIKPGIEFNFLKDPEAVRIVLTNSTYHKVTLFPWDTVVKTNITRDWRVHKLGALTNPDIFFLNKAEMVSWTKSKYWFNADSMAVAAAIWPSIVKTKPLRVKPVTCGEARGGLLADHYKQNDDIELSNLNVVIDIDVNEFKNRLLKLHQEEI